MLSDLVPAPRRGSPTGCRRRQPIVTDNDASESTRASAGFRDHLEPTARSRGRATDQFVVTLEVFTAAVESAAQTRETRWI